MEIESKLQLNYSTIVDSLNNVISETGRYVAQETDCKSTFYRVSYFDFNENYHPNTKCSSNPGPTNYRSVAM
jgi:hypothetical protein